MKATSANATNAAALAHFNGGDTRQASAAGGLTGGGSKGSGRPLRRSTLTACQLLLCTGDARRGDRVVAVLALDGDGLAGLEVAERARHGDRCRAGRLDGDDRAVGLHDVDGR